VPELTDVTALASQLIVKRASSSILVAELTKWC